jgi:outer membrane protein TolC
MRRALLITFALLTGCAAYHPQPISPSELARQFETRSLASEALHDWFVQSLGHDVEPWPPQRWDRAALTLAAYFYSPTLEVARSQWRTANAAIEAADAIPNPVLQLPFQYATPNPGPGAPFTTGPALDIPIETAGKRGYRVGQATHLAESARLTLASEAWKTTAQVRDALLALYAAHERVTLLARKDVAMRDIGSMIVTRRTLGEAAATDAAAALLADAQARADFASARVVEEDARAQLAAAIGVPVAALAGIDIDFDSVAAIPAAPSDADARHDAIFHRADLRASLADYAAAESALQLEVAKQYPDIHLGPGYSYDTGTHRIAFGLAGITLPIFDQNQGGIAQAEAKRKEAAARTAALQDAMLGDVDHNLASYRASVAVLPVADAHLAAARRQRDGAAATFAAGNLDRVAWTQAKADYATAVMAHLDALVAARKAANVLEDTLQRPLIRDEASPDPQLSEQEPRE